MWPARDYGDMYAKLKHNEERLSHYLLDRIGKRFLDLQDLQNPFFKEQSLPSSSITVINEAKYTNCWRGVPILKDALSLNIYQQLFYYLRPKTIIDLGAWAGGSALFYADQNDINGVKDYRIYSVDINFKYVAEQVKQDPRITFLNGDLTKFEDVFPEEMMMKMEHPIVVFEDCHVATVEMLSYFAKYMKKGDYAIIEDIHPSTLDAFPIPGKKTITIGETGKTKEPKMYEFMKLNKDFRVDNYFAAFFGQYCHTNGHGYLTKIQ